MVKQLLSVGVGLWLVAGSIAIASPSQPETTQAVFDHSALKKISFDISSIDPDGLIGPADGKRSLMYEFCIPGDDHHTAAIRQIDPTVQISRSRGRINCKPTEYLVIASTHNAQWRDILLAIARLDYVHHINQFFGE